MTNEDKPKIKLSELTDLYDIEDDTKSVVSTTETEKIDLSHKNFEETIEIIEEGT